MTRTREQQRDYMRDYRARKSAGAVPVDVAELPNPAGESVEDAVRAELEVLEAAARQTGTAAACLALARILDNIAAFPQHPAAARTLGDLLGRLRADSVVGSTGASKLAELRVLRQEKPGKRRSPA